jgi:Fe-S oxidoreductase
MPQRMYHEKKMKRCIQNLPWMKSKLDRLEGVRLRRIDELKAEIDAIEHSYVTLRCETCGHQFTVYYPKYIKGDYKRKCGVCKRRENREYTEQLEKLLIDNGIKFSRLYDYPYSIKPEIPHKGSLT